MAITKTVKLRNGLMVPDAYIRVDAFQGSKTSITYTANIYLSEVAFKGTDTEPSTPFLEQEVLEFVPDSAAEAAHVWEQCYAHLKSLDRFTDAADD
jgi:hypothetical protein